MKSLFAVLCAVSLPLWAQESEIFLHQLTESKLLEEAPIPPECFSDACLEKGMRSTVPTADAPPREPNETLAVIGSVVYVLGQFGLADQRFKESEQPLN
ncbi:hypothetical protein RDG78_001135 [Vibrio vulnificus]|uniref:hypothetical protein n=1 Tax=Vibrio vulnificus TaxID=672 RepID=UPI0021DB3AC6|nr:hypothetical protein [Vibrio vulnificus]ELE2040543.1 hypothetical protein [Vibrio vulnificus]MCU8157556.1 hypothetical protein [Vibrio vulnificus]MDS1830772.1 hypothetical protein [Vibrio vulnificus]